MIRVAMVGIFRMIIDYKDAYIKCVVLFTSQDVTVNTLGSNGERCAQFIALYP